MPRRDGTLALRCYIEGAGNHWRALCVDLDIAAQGTSLSETQRVLEEMIDTYLDGVLASPPKERARLLNRKSPIWTRVSIALRFFFASLFATRTSSDRVAVLCHHPCPA